MLTKNIEDKILNITNLATRTTLNAKINKLKGEIPSITNLATTATPDDKITEVKGKIHNISNLAATTALRTVGNKILNVINLVNI